MKEKAYDINNVELWIGAHPCDLETVDFINKFSDFKINVHYVEIPKADLGLKPAVINRHRDILHPMVLQSKGKYLWILNDDVEIRTNNFDKILEEEIEHYLSKKSDRIFYGKCDETFRIRKRGWLEQKYHNMDYACYPIITRETFEALGFFLPLEIAKSGADIALSAIMKGSIYDRSLRLPVTIHDKIIKGCDHEAFVFDGEGEVSLTKEGVNEYSDKLNKNIKNEEGEMLRPIDVTINLVYECKGCKQKNPINIFATPGRSNIYTCNYCNENLFVGRYDNELVSFVRGYVDNLRYNLVIGPYYIPDEDYHEP